MQTAVLFIVFNRPDTTKAVFEAIRSARPPRLYVAADGPRRDRAREGALCDEVRRLSTAVDWQCKVKTLFRDTNLGCRDAPSGAITWFFEHEEEGIILEDDVLPAANFFDYCETLLQRYRNTPEIMMISGCNPVAGRYESLYSYDFTNYALAWGWASWRRAWNLFDVSMKNWPECKRLRRLRAVPKATKVFEIIWHDIYDKTYQGQINTVWDYQWFFAVNSNHAFMTIPRENLILNIGHGERATHCKGDKPPWVRQLKLGSICGAYAHPPAVDNNPIIDRQFERVVFGVNKYTTIKHVVKTMIGEQNVARVRSLKALIAR